VEPASLNSRSFTFAPIALKGLMGFMACVQKENPWPSTRSPTPWAICVCSTWKKMKSARGTKCGFYPPCQGTGASNTLAIHRLFTLPCHSLEKLILNENKIPLVSHDGERSRFPQLKSISLDQNAISEWESVDQLNKFPQLHTLRLRWNPLNEKMGPGLARMVVTARIAKLTLLNGSEVRTSSSERECTHARSFDTWISNKNRSQQQSARRLRSTISSNATNHQARCDPHLLLTAHLLFARQDQDVRQAHPRYSELLECYGQPTVATANPANSHTLGDSLICMWPRMIITLPSHPPQLKNQFVWMQLFTCAQWW